MALAGTTYASVRSANRAARAAEVSMLARLRPLLRDADGTWGASAARHWQIDRSDPR